MCPDLSRLARMTIPQGGPMAVKFYIQTCAESRQDVSGYAWQLLFIKSDKQRRACIIFLSSACSS